MENLIVTKSNNVASIILNRPEVLNALDLLTVRELEEAVSGVEQDSNIKVIMISGLGNTFSAGADLKYLRSIKGTPEVETFIRQINNAFNKLAECRIPVIAKVRGFALAGGCELLQACDVVFAADDAKIGDQHSNFG